MQFKKDGKGETVLKCKKTVIIKYRLNSLASDFSMVSKSTGHKLSVGGTNLLLQSAGQQRNQPLLSWHPCTIGANVYSFGRGCYPHVCCTRALVRSLKWLATFELQQWGRSVFNHWDRIINEQRKRNKELACTDYHSTGSLSDTGCFALLSIY